MLTAHEQALIDAYRMVQDQANERIALTQDNDKGEYIIHDMLAGPTLESILWKGPIPKNSHDQRKAWSDAQRRLGELRDLRVIKTVIALHAQLSIEK